MEEVLGVILCVSQEAGFFFEATMEDLSVLCLTSLYCCETWTFTVADETKLHGVEHCIIRMCGVRLVDRVLVDVLHDKVGVAVKNDDMIIQNCLWWYGLAMPGNINSQIGEVMQVKLTGKRNKGQPRKLWKDSIKKDLEQYGLRKEDTYYRNKW